MGLTKGLRLNNPGNIERDGDPWQGLAPDQPDPRFCKFSTPEYGIRAICKIIRVYQKKYKARSIRDIINRWAPPTENPTDHYAANVSKWSGIPVDAVLDTSDPAVMAGIVKGIIRQENGVQPYPDETINAGVSLALEG